jgi:GNAT superfamily N-acetyltransferase
METGAEPVECRTVAFGSDVYREAVRLREAVLRRPLGLQWAPRDFDAEESSLHLGAFLGGRLVGTLVLRPREAGTLQMRQVAVAPEWRSRGIGSALVRFAECVASEHGYTSIMAHARVTALAFYRRLGYREVGEPFTEIGIPHREVVKVL